MIGRLELDGLEACPSLPWLEASWREPEPFWRALAAEHSARSGAPAKSRPFERYDFYHDAVARHVEGGRAAFRWIDRERGWQELSHAELHARASRKALEWASHGVAAGESVAIVLPLGPDFVVALATALRLGLVITVLPPEGDLFLARRLDALKPQRIETHPAFERLLSPFRPAILPEGPGPTVLAELPPPRTYPTATPLGAFFSPLDAKPDVPRPLLADDAYLRALRDGALVFGLGPGARIAAPGAHFLQSQPALLLAALLAGATYVHVTVEEVAAAPGLVAAEPFAAFGVVREVRDILSAAQVPIGKAWRQWWKDPAEGLDLMAWVDFVKACGLEKTPSGNVVLDAASGGAALFSARRRRIPDLTVLPAPGVPWTLADLNGTGAPAIGTAGLFAPGPPGAPPGATILALVHTRDWMYVGTRDARRRRGHTYLGEEVKACVERLPFVAECSIALAPSGSGSTPTLFVLLVFVGAREKDELAAQADEWRGRIAAEVSLHLGPEHLPDRVEIYPLHARRTPKGAVDEGYCAAQYLMGGLYLKSARPANVLLARLRGLAILEKPRA